jgi:hypothetical protein
MSKTEDLIILDPNDYVLEDKKQPDERPLWFVQRGQYNDGTASIHVSLNTTDQSVAIEACDLIARVVKNLMLTSVEADRSPEQK